METAGPDFQLNINGNAYAFNSTTIDLCLSVFCRAEFRKTKVGVKMHTLYDIKTSAPSFIHITSASVHDAGKCDGFIELRTKRILYLLPGQLRYQS